MAIKLVEVLKDVEMAVQGRLAHSFSHFVHKERRSLNRDALRKKIKMS